MHDVQDAERGCEAEVAAFGQVARIGRVERHLVRSKAVVLDTELPGAEVADEIGQPSEILGGWIGADVEILRGSDEAVGVDGNAPDDDVLDRRGIGAVGSRRDPAPGSPA